MPAVDIDDEFYTPSDDEPFMNPQQLEYFRKKLLNWREQLLRECTEMIQNMQDQTNNEADIIDVACHEMNQAIELRARDRERKLINKIDEAIRRIEEGSYGYCEETGEPISIKRLEARPIATMTIEAQERHERRERVYREEVL